MKRSIITTDGNGNIIMPTDINATAMSEWGTLRPVRSNRPDIPCRTEGSLQERSFKGIWDKAKHTGIR